MRENRPYGLEGGEAGSTGLPYPYACGCSWCGVHRGKKETLRPVTAGGFDDRESDRADQRSG